MPLARRTLITAAIAAATLGAAPWAHAQADFPTRAVNIVTPFPPGSGPDALLRVITEKLGQLWKQPVVVQNKPGAGGIVAIEATRRLPADGYTLVQFDSEQLVALPLLYKSRARDISVLDHFDMVAPIFSTPFLVVVPTGSPWKNLDDLIKAAKAAPGKVNYGSWGVGSPGHLGGEQLELATGIQMQHIPFKGQGDMFTALATGEIAWSLGSIPSSNAMYKAGKVRYLAVAGPRRIPQMADVPTSAEAGGPRDFVQSSFVVLAAPKGAPAAVRQKIAQDMAKVMQDPELKTRMETFAFERIDWSPEEIVKQARAKGQMYDTLIQRKHITLE
ncbi:MAG: tripartite tricarboxylate transporter substrate binding protein [Burkholderiaceae bacterium]